MKRRPRDIGTRADRPCKVCDKPRPKGRPVYCSDECAAIGYAEQHRARQERRMQACQRCGGQKEFGTRGGRFCAECRRLHGDTVQQLEQERGRRRAQKLLEGKLAAGKRVKSRRSNVPPGQKWCARCQEFRPITSFPLRKEGGKPASYCKPCQRFYNTERRIKLTFGLTWDEYELLLACQGGKCAICGGRPRRHMLAVDHDHKTGEIRGLLCSRCNHKLLGSANDDPARLRRAADYLEEYGPREVFGDPKYVPGSAPPPQAADAVTLLRAAGYGEPEARPVVAAEAERDDYLGALVRVAQIPEARPVVDPHDGTRHDDIENVPFPGLEAVK